MQVKNKCGMLKYFIYTVLFACAVTFLVDYSRNQSSRSHFKKLISYFFNTNRVLLTTDELKQFNGVDRKELYISLLGNVFDVTNGTQHYGPGQSYNIFVGHDASRCFVTGKFNQEDVSDEVADLSHYELRALKKWLQFYKTNYKKIGKLIGRYYTREGKLTPYGKVVKSLIRQAEKSHNDDELVKRKFPPCNVEWDVSKGTRVWCTRKSGGIERDWVGVPRQLFMPGHNGYKCTCVKENDLNMGNVKEYEGCDSSSPSCFVKNQ